MYKSILYWLVSLTLLNQCSIFNRNSGHSKISLEWRVEHFVYDNGASQRLSKNAIVDETILYPHNNSIKKVDINSGEVLHEYIGPENHWYFPNYMTLIDEHLYAFSGNRDIIIKLKYDDFDVVWEKQFEGFRFGSRSSIAHLDNQILFSNTRGTIDFINVNGEKESVSFDDNLEFNVQNSGSSLLTFGGDKLGHRDSTITTITRRNSQTLKPIWKFVTKMGSSMAARTPLHEEENRIYATFAEGPDNTPGGIMVCINGETGEEIWSQLGWFEDFSVDDKHIYGHSGGGIQAYDKFTGAFKWRVDYTGYSMNGIASGNGFVVDTHGETLNAYDAETGELVAEYPAKEDGYFVDVMFHDGYFFATTYFSLFKFKIE